MPDRPLIELGELSKPATVLIEKISEAIGGIFKPWQAIRVAKAEAAAQRIQAKAKIQVTDLYKRAFLRFLEEEAKKQTNIESIAKRALPLLEKTSTPEKIENDWITNFFDKCRIISNDDMQQLWSKILAGEANSPGAFSRRTVNLLADLDKSDAEMFTRLCGFGWDIGGRIVPLIFDTQGEIYNRNGLYFSVLIHLESLGLVQFGGIGGYEQLKLPKKCKVSYYGKPAELTFPQDADNTLRLGLALLTKAGEELAPVCGSKPVDGFFDFVYDKWAENSLVPKRETAGSLVI